MAWKKGPLPPDTWNYGGVVPVGETLAGGFYFADFCGDHVNICPGDRVLQAHEVALYSNVLQPPATGTSRHGQK
jgi:hypothetical protein